MSCRFQNGPQQVEALIKDGETMLMFLDRVLQWLKAPMTFGRVINLFNKFDNDGDNLLSAEDFSVAMRMMEVAVNLQTCLGEAL